MLHIIQKIALGLIERRKNHRLEVHIPSKVNLKNGIEIHGTTTDLSYKGAFFEFNMPFDAISGDYCIFTLFLKQGHRAEEMKFKCRITDFREDGVGLDFKAICEEEYMNFILLLAEFYPEPDEFMKELDQESAQHWVRTT